jgi:hypothetical protein
MSRPPLCAHPLPEHRSGLGVAREKESRNMETKPLPIDVPDTPWTVVRIRDGHHKGMHIYCDDEGLFYFVDLGNPGEDRDGTMITAPRCVLLQLNEDGVDEIIHCQRAWGCDLDRRNALLMIGIELDDDLAANIGDATVL